MNATSTPSATHYDAIVIGGGINGCGVARDLALRGLKILLLEKGDLGMGTSWASSGMIHGGIRYLLHDIATTKKSCKDSGYIQKIAPHLIFRIPMLMPVPVSDGIKGFINLEGGDAFFQLYDRYQPLKGGKPHLRLSPEETQKLEPLIRRDIRGSLLMDEWGIDVPRLCIANALDAAEHGATVRTWTRVTGFIKEHGRIQGVTTHDDITGEEETIRCDLVVNCTGPWSPLVANMADTSVKLRPGKGVHLILDRRLSNIGVIATAVDGRDVFMIPHENTSMIGTTDDDYYGDPDDLSVTEDEIEYLLDALESVIPSVREARIMKTIAGVRPTLYERAKYEDDLTRDHRIYDHALRNGPAGIISLAGGKLAAYRVMAEETADLVCHKLGKPSRCSTHSRPLPGGDRLPDAEALAERWKLSPYLVSRMISRHGSRAERILDQLGDHPEWGHMVCSCEPICEAELRYCARHELVRRPLDLLSRSHLGEGPCQGLGCLAQAAWIVGDELGYDRERISRELTSLLQEKWRWRRPVLSGVQLAGEELYRMVHQALQTAEHGASNETEVF